MFKYLNNAYLGPDVPHILRQNKTKPAFKLNGLGIARFFSIGHHEPRWRPRRVGGQQPNDRPFTCPARPATDLTAAFPPSRRRGIYKKERAAIRRAAEARAEAVTSPGPRDVGTTTTQLQVVACAPIRDSPAVLNCRRCYAPSTPLHFLKTRRRGKMEAARFCFSRFDTPWAATSLAGICNCGVLRRAYVRPVFFVGYAVSTTGRHCKSFAT